MKATKTPYIALMALLLVSCDQPDPPKARTELSKMIGSDVLITTSHPVYLKPSGVAPEPPSPAVNYLIGRIESVESTGVVVDLKGDPGRIWVGLPSIVSVKALR